MTPKKVQRGGKIRINTADHSAESDIHSIFLSGPTVCMSFFTTSMTFLCGSSFPPVCQLHIQHLLSSISAFPPNHMSKPSQVCFSLCLQMAQPELYLFLILPILVILIGAHQLKGVIGKKHHPPHLRSSATSNTTEQQIYSSVVTV